MRIAAVGGTSYNEVELEDFLLKLHQKYPDATVVTGDGRGAERKVRTILEACGQKVEVPPLYEKFFGPYANDCHVNSILLDVSVVLIIERPRVAAQRSLRTS